MTQTYTVAAVQMNSSDQPQHNLEQIDHWLGRAHEQKAQLAVLPENCLFMGSDRGRSELAQQADVWRQALSALAQKHQLWLVAGSLPVPGLRKLTNTCWVFAPSGETLARYDKMHLFGFRSDTERYDESAVFEAGDQPQVVDIEGFKLGLGICYDLRFPEFFRQGPMADVWALPAAFTYTTG